MSRKIQVDEAAILGWYVRQRKSTTWITEHLGYSVRTIRRVLKKNHISLRCRRCNLVKNMRKTRVNLDELLKDLQQGTASRVSLAKKYGVSRPRIYQLARQLGMSTGRVYRRQYGYDRRVQFQHQKMQRWAEKRNKTEQLYRQLSGLWMLGATLRQIAQQMHRPAQTISTIIRRARVKWPELFPRRRYCLRGHKVTKECL